MGVSLLEASLCSSVLSWPSTSRFIMLSLQFQAEVAASSQLQLPCFYFNATMKYFIYHFGYSAL